ncbi:MAG: tetratricopeptide repeat protein [Planctomycetota bacterium]|nr:tetratricopeptide repeat protein [Planctomycetota bacterium]
MAREIAERLLVHNADHEPLLNTLFEIQRAQRDYSAYAITGERLLELNPGDSAIRVAVMIAHIERGRMALALTQWNTYGPSLPRLLRWPLIFHMRSLNSRRHEFLADFGPDEETALELAAGNDEIRTLLEAGYWTAAKKRAEELLEEHPRTAPILNNLAEAFYQLNQLDNAKRQYNRVLEFDPHNLFALGNLTRFQVLQGKLAEARQSASRMLASQDDRDDAWAIRARALSYLGDHQAVWEQWLAAGRAKVQLLGPSQARFMHFAAVAAARLGDAHSAKQLWKQALKEHNGLNIAAQNLKNLDRPVEQRNGAWAFDFVEWLGASALRSLNDGSPATAINRWFRSHSEAIELVPILLDRGDMFARRFACAITVAADDDRLWDALLRFVKGDQGEDELRILAANTLQKHEVVGNDRPLRMWIDGKWQDITPHWFEVTDSAVDPPYEEPVQTLYECGVEALYKGDGEAGEKFFRAALEIKSDAPNLVHNLATSLFEQGKTQEGTNLIHRNHKQHPDYMHSALSVAQFEAAAGNVEKAESILARFSKLTNFHRTGYAALSMAQIEVALAKNDVDAAKRWYESWRKHDPDSPSLGGFLRRIERR